MGAFWFFAEVFLDVGFAFEGCFFCESRGSACCVLGEHASAFAEECDELVGCPVGTFIGEVAVLSFEEC